MALKHTHNHKNTGVKLSKKKISFYIDMDMIMIAIADITFIESWGADHAEVKKEMKKLTATKIEKHIISTLRDRGRDYFDFYNDKNDELSETSLAVVKEKAHGLFPNLI